MPANRRAWEKAVRRFRSRLRRLERACRDADLATWRNRKSRLAMLHTIATHNSYQAGEVAFLRRILGKWPPPSGGLTW